MKGYFFILRNYIIEPEVYLQEEILLWSDAWSQNNSIIVNGAKRCIFATYLIT